MSSSAFENLIRKYPAHRHALEVIREWILEHYSQTIVDPRIISRDCRAVDVRELATTLSLLIESDVFKQLYAVELLPTETLLTDDLYRSPKEVPDIVRDRWDRPVNTSHNRIVPVLKIMNKRALDV
jgi:hypothetical protein